MTNRSMFRRLGAFAAVAFMLSGCDLDLANPNAPREEEVLTNVDGVLAAVVGMQGIYGQAVEDYIVPSSLVTDEWATTTRSLLSYQSLFTGQNFENTYDIVNAPYAATYQVVRAANSLLSSEVPLTKGTRAGVSAVAKLFKAMALGSAAQIYEQLPVTTSMTGAAPQPRNAVFDTAIALLESARADWTSVPDTALNQFRTRALATGIDMIPTIDAMIARYALFRGDYQKANTAALRVSPTAVSLLNYPAPTTNPIYGLAISLRYVGGVKSFVDSAEPGDKRPAYWLNTAAAPEAGNPSDSTFYQLRKYNTPNVPFPLWLPDEMKLIRAEAQARAGNLDAARTLINEVRMQTTASLDEPAAGFTTALTAAELPDLQAILRQVAYERRYELYMQGLRWEDARRLPVTTVTPFNFLPLPAVECRNNPNVGGIGGCA